MSENNISYFAYGSNMNPLRMKDRKIMFSKRVRAILEGWRLEFNKIASVHTGEGFTNIVTDKHSNVEGVLYTIECSGIGKLDQYEGFPDHYGQIELYVRLDDGEKAKAVTYIAQSDKTMDGLKPSKAYLKHLLKGCDSLSKEYCQRLKNQETL